MTPPDGEALVSRIGSLEIDWPRSIGYFGGCALAVGLGLIDPPVGGDSQGTIRFVTPEGATDDPVD